MWNRRTVLLLSVCLVVLGGLLVALLGRGAVVAAEPDLQAVFEQKYQAWHDYIRQPEIAGSSTIGPYVTNQPFRDIVALGVPALPLIIGKVEEGGGVFMAGAASIILKRRNWREGDRIWTWWKTGRLDVPKEFDAHFASWQEARARHDSKKAAADLANLEGIGVLVLPLLVGKVASGQSEDLIPAISRLTDGAAKADATAQQVLAWWAKDKAKWTLPEEKQPPSAPPPPVPQ